MLSIDQERDFSTTQDNGLGALGSEGGDHLPEIPAGFLAELMKRKLLKDHTVNFGPLFRAVAPFVGGEQILDLGR